MNDKNQSALKYLQSQLKKKRIALERAKLKPNTPESEIADIESAIEALEYLIKAVTSDGKTDA